MKITINKDDKELQLKLDDDSTIIEVIKQFKVILSWIGFLNFSIEKYMPTEEDIAINEFGDVTFEENNE